MDVPANPAEAPSFPPLGWQQPAARSAVMALAGIGNWLQVGFLRCPPVEVPHETRYLCCRSAGSSPRSALQSWPQSTADNWLQVH